MDAKDILLLDTNFLIEKTKGLDKLIVELSKSTTVIISQFIIDEFIGVKLREFNDKIKKIEEMKDIYKDLISEITYKKTPETATQSLQNIYNKAFKRIKDLTIIPYELNDTLFKKVIDRSKKKTPPFFNEANSSDKGFKDTIFWLNILDYFSQKKLDQKNIVLLTRDSGFIKYRDLLAKEFEEYTGLNISIENNDFSEHYLKNNTPKEEKVVIVEEGIAMPINEREHYREILSTLLNDFCYTSYYNYDGPFDEPNFETFSKLNMKNAKEILNNLDKLISQNLFSSDISPSLILSDYVETLDFYSIKIKTLEELSLVYNDLKSRYPEFLDTFANEFAKFINKLFNDTIATLNETLPF